MSSFPSSQYFFVGNFNEIEIVPFVFGGNKESPGSHSGVLDSNGLNLISARVGFNVMSNPEEIDNLTYQSII